LKITKTIQIFGATFSNVKAIFTENGLGHILGDFFTNSSGHPAQKQSHTAFEQRHYATVPKNKRAPNNKERSKAV
jgi:hypothetical protein